MQRRPRHTCSVPEAAFSQQARVALLHTHCIKISCCTAFGCLSLVLSILLSASLLTACHLYTAAQFS